MLGPTPIASLAAKLAFRASTAFCTGTKGRVDLCCRFPNAVTGQPDDLAFELPEATLVRTKLGPTASRVAPTAT